MFRPFLNEPMRPAQVAAVSPSRVPLLGSLWFLFADDRFWFNSVRGSPLLKAAGRGEQIAVLIDDFDPPTRIMQVRIRGEGRVEPQDSGRTAAIYRRYLGEAADAWPLSFPERLSDPGWVLWSVPPASGMALESSGFMDEQVLRWNHIAQSPL